MADSQPEAEIRKAAARRTPPALAQRQHPEPQQPQAGTPYVGRSIWGKPSPHTHNAIMTSRLLIAH